MDGPSRMAAQPVLSILTLGQQWVNFFTRACICAVFTKECPQALTTKVLKS